MNKIIIAFVTVMIILAILLSIDYTPSTFQNDNTLINPSKKNYSAISSEHFYHLEPILYNKDNSISLNDNRIVSSILMNNAEDTAKYIINLQNDFSYTYEYNNKSYTIPVIFLAINSNNKEIINVVLSNKHINKNIITKINLIDNNNNSFAASLSPLAYSVFTRNTYATEMLIKNGANVDLIISGNRTALFYANSKETIKLLLNNGANINALSSQGNTALMQAVNRNNVDTAKELLDNGLNPNHYNNVHSTPLIAAINKRNINMVKLLIEYGADVNMFTKESQSPLMVAVTNADLNIFKLLIEKGADVNIANNYGKTCMYYMQSNENHWIIWRAMVEVVKNKIDINHQDINGNTILHINPERYLLYKELDPNLNIQNLQGDTPLHILVSNKDIIDKDIIAAYLENGANKNIKNNNKKTIYDIAKENNNEEIAKFILSYK